MIPIVIRTTKIGEGMPKICVPIVEVTENAILQAAKTIKTTPADLVEWRADWFQSVFDIQTVKNVLVQLREILDDLPLLFTFRTKNEGGERAIHFRQYYDLLTAVAATDLVDLIDVEVFFETEDRMRHLIDELQMCHVKVIGSNHDFTKTPRKEQIVHRLCYIQSVGADIPKIAVMPQNDEDVLVLLEATKEMATEHANCPIITMSMSELGMISRVQGEKYGSAVTFGSVGKTSAPGQIEVKKLKEMLENIHCNIE